MSRNQTHHRRSTIEDVAREACVSVATVSRSLRGLPNVAASTRARVAAVAADLDYAPHPAASRLAAGRTNTVTVVAPAISGWYFSNVVAGVEAICAEAGYDVMVVGIDSIDDISRLCGENYRLEQRTDGVVVVDVPVTRRDADAIASRGVHLATVGTTTPGHPSVGIDDRHVGAMVAQYLCDLGHDHIGVLGGGQDDSFNFEVPRLRHQGFVGALAERGIEFDPHLFEPGDFHVDGGQRAMAALLDRAAPPSAVFAMSDEMAFGALMELWQRGLGAGTDVSVIGVDDHEFSRVVALTTIRLPVVDLGAAVARLLIRALRPDASEDRIDREPRLAPIELVVRSTTSPRS